MWNFSNYILLYIFKQAMTHQLIKIELKVLDLKKK